MYVARMKLVWPFLLVLSFTTIARAEGDDTAGRQSAREHYRKGSVAYELGHYDVAISEYEAAYSAFNEPTLLYNLGQAHRLAKHLSEALHFYRMYLVKVPDAPNRADVEARIGALNAALAQQSPAQHQPTPPSTATTTATSASPPPSSTKTEETQAQPAVVATVAPADRSKARTLKVSGIVVGVLGVGLVGAGVGVGFVAKKAGDDISRADANHQPFDPSKYATYQNDQIISGVLIGVGAAAVVTGTVLAIVGARRGRAPMAVQIAPQVSTGHASLSATVQF
ncbi:MAG: Thiol-disulfide isomerase [bacterium]|nr:Thiol-disulfide isomerase [bacterium]